MPAPIDPNTSFLGGGGLNIGQQQDQQPGLLDMLGNSSAEQQPFNQSHVDAEYARILAQPGWAVADPGALANTVMNNLGLANKGGANGFWTMQGRPPQGEGWATQSGAGDASLDNWHLLPPGWRSPQYMMRNGRVIDRSLTNPTDYLRSKGVEPGALQVGPGGAYGMPASAGYFNSDRGFFWPGQIEPWTPMQGIRG